MDLIVTEAPTNDIINEALETDLFGDQYPGHNIRDISLNEKNAIEEALKIKNYISPLSSILEEISDIISDNESSTSTIEDLPHKFQDTKQTKIVETEKIISSFVTPNMFSNIPRDQVIDEMNEELFDLRKKVSMSINMKSFINKLGKNEDIDYEIRFISEYSKKKFQIYILPDDFLSLTRDEILELYNKTNFSFSLELWTISLLDPIKQLYTFLNKLLRFPVNLSAIKEKR